MKVVLCYLKTFFIALSGYIGFFLGGFDGLLRTLILFVIIDYLSGLMCAVVNKNLSSEIGARGIFKKILIFLIIGTAHNIDAYLFNDSDILRTAVVFFYISNEGLSLLENIGNLGLPFPEKLKSALIQIKKR